MGGRDGWGGAVAEYLKFSRRKTTLLRFCSMNEKIVLLPKFKTRDVRTADFGAPRLQNSTRTLRPCSVSWDSLLLILDSQQATHTLRRWGAIIIFWGSQPASQPHCRQSGELTDWLTDCGHHISTTLRSCRRPARPSSIPARRCICFAALCVSG